MIKPQTLLLGLFLFLCFQIPVYADCSIDCPSARRTGAICNDGSSSNATGSGACSGHGGVYCWVCQPGILYHEISKPAEKDISFQFSRQNSSIIKINWSGASNEDGYVMAIYDLNGTRILNSVLHKNQMSVPMNFVPVQGCYYVIIRQDKKVLYGQKVVFIN